MTRALTAVQTQLAERELARGKGFVLENDRLQEAVAAAKLCAGEAELRGRWSGGRELLRRGRLKREQLSPLR